MNQWKGKKWYCYGTSMTDNTCLYKGDITGQFSKYLAQYAGLEEHNFGKGASGIIPSLHKEDNIKTRCMRLDDGKAEADLITVEVIPNDMKGDLGDVTDLSDDTFCGNLHQILEYLLTNTNAVVVVLIASRGRYNRRDPTKTSPPTGDGVKNRMLWESATETVCKMHGVPCWNAAAEAGLGFFRAIRDDTLVRDQIHLTDKGGELLAKFYWGKLQTLYPID